MGGFIVLWFALAAVLIVAELFSLDLTLGLLGGAAAIAGVSAVIGAPAVLQVVVFIIAALVALAAIRPIARRHLRMTRTERTGVDRLPGATGLVLQEITVDGGLIKLDGESWSARLEESISTDPVPEGSRVSVVRIEGATAIVHALD